MKVERDPKASKTLRAKARNVVASAQRKAPGLLAGVSAGVNSPKGLRMGDFSILSTGRILYKGKSIRRVH